MKLYYLSFIIFSAQEQMSERETQEASQQSSLMQDTSHQYTRFVSPISDNGIWIASSLSSCNFTEYMTTFISVEHPYAQLQNVQKTEASQVNRYYPFVEIPLFYFLQQKDRHYVFIFCRNNVNQVTSTEKPSTSAIGQSSGNPVAPPRTRRSSSHNSLLSSDSHCDIQAANAISGGVQANQDLPYMTPPLLMLLPPQPQPNNPQQHFSGDSQDSSNCFYIPCFLRDSLIQCVSNLTVCVIICYTEGYTSISVREPLANIIAQTKASYRQNQSTRPITDPHYATVSDDSGKRMYTIQRLQNWGLTVI